jgi:hypothetical protein
MQNIAKIVTDMPDSLASEKPATQPGLPAGFMLSTMRRGRAALSMEKR